MANIKVICVINDTPEDIYFNNKETPSDNVTVKAGQSGFTPGKNQEGCDIPDCSDSRYYDGHHFSIEKQSDHTVLYAIWKIDNQVYYSSADYYRSACEETKIPGDSTFNDKPKVIWVKSDSIKLYDIDSPVIKINNTFYGGHYQADIPVIGPDFHWEHAYVRVRPQYNDPNEYVDFCCYGGVTPSGGIKNYYPVVQTVGDLTLARTICCFDPNDTRDNYDRKKGGDLIFGDCCGVLYLISGVCHQMANRVLFAGFGSPIMYPNVSFVTYILWGHYGNPGGNPGTSIVDLDWFTYLAMCKYKIAQPQAGILKDTAALTQAKNEIHDQLLTTAGNIKQNDPVLASTIEFEVNNAGDKNIESNRMVNLIQVTFGPQYDSTKTNNILSAHKNFMNFKNQYDQGLLQKNITPDKYALDVNQQFSDLLEKFYQELGDADYQKLLRAGYDDKYVLVNPDILAEVYSNL